MQQPYSWPQLAALSLSRQFPRLRGRGDDAVVELVRRIGPIQSQAARAPFLCAAARLPGATRAAVTSAHESMRLVRSTSLRGTVHTSTREAHRALSAVASRAQAALWRRTIKLTAEQLAAFRAELERITEPEWLIHEAIESRFRDWFIEQDLHASLAAIDNQAGRFVFRSHPAMLRRPVAGGWEGQGEVAYRAAQHAVGERPSDPQRALEELVRRHLAASGPLTRRDLAWWSGAGLRQVDDAIASLGDDVTRRPGPNGLDYLDLADISNASTADPGIRLLPEYDALLLAYDPSARHRFADEAAIAHSWNRANGVHSPTVLVDGRLRGRWRLERRAGKATIAVEMFEGERLIDPGELVGPAAAVTAVLDVPVTDVTIGRV